MKDSQMELFADDTTFVKSVKNTDRETDGALHKITDSFIASKLTVILGKCEAKPFGCRLPQKTILNDELCYKSACK